MSRLAALHIPFAGGVDEDVDPKVLPDGLWADLANGRLHRAGDLRLRRGWRPVDMTQRGDDDSVGGEGVAQDLYSVNGALVALLRGAQVTQPLSLASFTNHAAAAPWVRRRQRPVCPVTGVRRRGNMPDLLAHVVRGSAAVTADGVFGATVQQTTAATAAMGLRVFRLDTDETIVYDDLPAFNPAGRRKLVSLGATLGLVEINASDDLRLRLIDPASASGVVDNSTTTLVTGTVSFFDACTAIATTDTPAAIYVAWVDGGGVFFGRFTTAGVQVGVTKTVVAANATACAIASNDTTVHVAYNNAANEIQLLSFDAASPFGNDVGPTAVNAGVAVTTGAFCVARGSASIFVASEAFAQRTTIVNRLTTSHGTNTRTDHDSSSLVGGFLVASDTAAVMVARGRSASSLLNDVVLMAEDGPWAFPAWGTGTTFGGGAGVPLETPLAPAQNLSGVALASYARLSDTSNTTRTGASTSGGSLYTRQVGTSSMNVFATGPRPGAGIGGVLYIAGGTLTAHAPSGDVIENGMAKPVIFSLTESNGSGTLANATYSYRAVVTWTDRDGRIHRSPVSNPLSITTTGANDTVTVLVHVGKTLRRDPENASQPKAELYRTEGGPGELFYLVATATCGATDDEVSLTDTLPDASILDNKRLYTEGEFGAVSGALDVAPPSASAYAAAVRDRLVLAGADAGYQISQILLPEEPVAFTQPGVSGPGALVYFDSVEGDITGLATLDDTIVLGTRTALFVTSAPGAAGPNLAGVGEFESPARMPSDVGVANAFSMVEDAAGLWFLADADKLFVLPRGQATPVWGGKSVQVQLAAGAVVGAGREFADDITLWGLTSAVAVWRTVQESQWGRDSLPFTPSRLITHQGAAYAVASDGVVWAQDSSAYGDGASGATAVALTATTGYFAVFDQAGYGRLAAVELLGEFRAAAAILVEIRYDDDTAFTSLGTHTVSGLASGQLFQRQWYPARQRGGKFQLRFTMTPSVTTTEGCRLTGLTVYYTKRSGPTRLASARRI